MFLTKKILINNLLKGDDFKYLFFEFNRNIARRNKLTDFNSTSPSPLPTPA